MYYNEYRNTKPIFWIVEKFHVYLKNIELLLGMDIFVKKVYSTVLLWYYVCVDDDSKEKTDNNFIRVLIFMTNIICNLVILWDNSNNVKMCNIQQNHRK